MAVCPSRRGPVTGNECADNLRIDGRAREGWHAVNLSDLTLVAHHHSAGALRPRIARNRKLLGVDAFDDLADVADAPVRDRPKLLVWGEL